MTTVFDVADYILKKTGPLSSMKLQKLCYYSQAWHLVWEEKPLFNEKIEAWANGPVVRALYSAHRGQFGISEVPAYTGGDASLLTADETSTIDAVLDFYGQMTAHQLSELTHAERPWADARSGLPAGARSSVVIENIAMAAYYDSLTSNANQQN